MTKTLLLALAASLALAGCDKSEPDAAEQSKAETNQTEQSASKPKEIGYGKIDDGIYSNDYFKGLSVKVPDGWAVQSQAEQQEMMRVGGELVAGEDKNLQNIMKASEKQSVNLFSFFKYEIGKPVPFNPSIIAVAEKVGNQPGIKRGSDYLFHVKNLLQSGQMNYSFPGESSTVDLSGVSFDVMTAALKAGPTSVTQEYYAAKMDDYMLGFIISYADNEQKQELKDIIGNINFSN